MRAPQELRCAGQWDTVVTEHEYDGETLVAVDFSRSCADLTVDVIDDTAIVITDSNQFEFELPSEASEVTTNNGVLTITE